ncbi:hypothetical protein FB384_002042 [Prauserella sediminis]|uniref:Uncharacterized protein n=1 Tax=Prauserella sediminis TaxID=577680 RepID=A0A839XQG6_9PSEU|nr:hypothetical protein [Prauserella sediminis]
MGARPVSDNRPDHALQVVSPGAMTTLRHPVIRRNTGGHFHPDLRKPPDRRRTSATPLDGGHTRSPARRPSAPSSRSPHAATAGVPTTRPSDPAGSVTPGDAPHPDPSQRPLRNHHRVNGGRPAPADPVTARTHQVATVCPAALPAISVAKCRPGARPGGVHLDAHLPDVARHRPRTTRVTSARGGASTATTPPRPRVRRERPVSRRHRASRPAGPHRTATAGPNDGLPEMTAQPETTASRRGSARSQPDRHRGHR